MHPEENLTRLGDLTIKMLGAMDNPRLKTKAMETYGILLFLVLVLPRYRLRVGPEYEKLLEAGQLVLRYVEILKSSPVILPVNARQVSHPNPCLS